MGLLGVQGPRQSLVLGEDTVLDGFDDMNRSRLHMPRTGSHLALWKEAPVPEEKKASLQQQQAQLFWHEHSLLTIY